MRGGPPRRSFRPGSSCFVGPCRQRERGLSSVGREHYPYDMGGIHSPCSVSVVVSSLPERVLDLRWQPPPALTSKCLCAAGQRQYQCEPDSGTYVLRPTAVAFVPLFNVKTGADISVKISSWWVWMLDD
jgi:hypothetical protein